MRELFVAIFMAVLIVSISVFALYCLVNSGISVKIEKCDTSKTQVVCEKRP